MRTGGRENVNRIIKTKDVLRTSLDDVIELIV